MIPANARLADGSTRFLRESLSRLRWATIAALLLLTLLQPMTGRFGMPSWSLLLLFAVYNALCQGLQTVRPAFHSFARQAVLDLPVVGSVYFLSAHPGGAPFVLVILAVVCAAVVLSLRGTLFYTAAAMLMTTGIELPFLAGSATGSGALELGSRVIALALVGIGTTVLTRHMNLERAAARANRDEAERFAELDRLRRSFIATVSHELQTPLAAMRVTLGLLGASAGDRLEPAERSLLETARRNTQHLGLLIDDLLALNQLEAGTLHVDRQRLDVRAVVAAAVGTIHPLLDDKGQTIEVDLPATPLPVDGDTRRLVQVIANLLHNAHRHTPPGTHVNVSAGELSNEILITVRDNGPGITPADLEAIFQRFHRLSAHGTGSGLGLAIARELVDRHGGRVRVESRPGQGSAFHVVLPHAAEETSDDPQAADCRG